MNCDTPDCHIEDENWTEFDTECALAGGIYMAPKNAVDQMTEAAVEVRH